MRHYFCYYLFSFSFPVTRIGHPVSLNWSSKNNEKTPKNEQPTFLDWPIIHHDEYETKTRFLSLHFLLRRRLFYWPTLLHCSPIFERFWLPNATAEISIFRWPCCQHQPRLCQTSEYESWFSSERGTASTRWILDIYGPPCSKNASRRSSIVWVERSSIGINAFRQCSRSHGAQRCRQELEFAAKIRHYDCVHFSTF